VTLKAPAAVYRNEPDQFKTGDWVGIETVAGYKKARVYDVHWESATLDAFVFRDDGSREKLTGVPFVAVTLLERLDTEGAQASQMYGAMDRFTERFLQHAERPGGTKPGHTVTRESARDIARGCALRASHKGGQ
jgi:hypothetical protein